MSYNDSATFSEMKERYPSRYILECSSPARDIPECEEPGLYYRQLSSGQIIVACEEEFPAWDLVAFALDLTIEKMSRPPHYLPAPPQSRRNDSSQIWAVLGRS